MQDLSFLSGVWFGEYMQKQPSSRHLLLWWGVNSTLVITAAAFTSTAGAGHCHRLYYPRYWGEKHDGDEQSYPNHP